MIVYVCVYMFLSIYVFRAQSTWALHIAHRNDKKVFQGKKKNMCNKYTCGHLTLAVLVYLFVSGESYPNQIITVFTIVMWHTKGYQK